MLSDMTVPHVGLDRSSVCSRDAATHHNRPVKPRYFHFLPPLTEAES